MRGSGVKIEPALESPVDRPRLSSRKSPRSLLLIALLVGGFALLVVKTAWLCDDAFITFRTVDNFLHGRGLTWNANERVQAYTNPLWMLLVSAVAWFTEEIPTTSIVLSIAVSVVAVGLFALRSRVSTLGLALFFAALCFSKTFVEYSTSGLENPLSHFLIVGLILSLERERRTPRSLFVPALLAGLAFVNRMDSVLVFAPALAWLWLRLPSRRALGWLALGFAPALCWEAFSLVYYGFLVPNTAFAKLGSGIPRAEYLAQGLRYLLRSADVDPVTPLVIGSGVIAGIASRDARRSMLALGAALYTLYVVWVGGDFMLGRLFAAPFLLGSYLIARGLADLRTSGAWIALGVLLYFGLWNDNAPIRTEADFALSSTWREHTDASGISDERAIYFRSTGLVFGSKPVPEHPFVAEALRGPTPVTVRSTVGMFGFFSGPGIHVIDDLALGDPLLARIPHVVRDWNRNDVLTWRPGHLRRHVPPGYRETLESGENRIADADLARFYDKLSLVIRGSLFDGERWKEIWAFLRGANDPLLDSYLRSLGE